MIKRPQLLRFLLLAATIAWPGTARAQAPGAHPFKVARFSIGGDGGTDYLTVEPGTGRVFVSHTHDGGGRAAGRHLDAAERWHRAGPEVRQQQFITSACNSMVDMFDSQILAVTRRIPIPTGGLDGIMYDRRLLRPTYPDDQPQPSEGTAVSSIRRVGRHWSARSMFEDTGPEAPRATATAGSSSTSKARAP